MLTNNCKFQYINISKLVISDLQNDVVSNTITVFQNNIGANMIKVDQFMSNAPSHFTIVTSLCFCNATKTTKYIAITLLV